MNRGRGCESVIGSLRLPFFSPLVIHGAKAYSTVLMWGVYFILAIYFYIMWKKELQNQNFTIREIEILTKVSKSKIARKLKGGNEFE